MEGFYLGNGNKRPKLEDYRREFGINGQMIYTLDKIRYEEKQQRLKETRETNKKASQYAANLGWGSLPAKQNKVSKKKKGDSTWKIKNL